MSALNDARYFWAIVLIAVVGAGLGCGEAIAQQPKTITNSIGMKLVLIPKGSFTMGSPVTEAGSDDDERQHEVTISKDYYLGVFEVTQVQYKKLMALNPSYFQGDKVAVKVPAEKHPNTGRTIEDAKIIPRDSSNYPVDSVTWDDAVLFCKRLSNLSEEKKAGRVYRLPTEAEWEYACRAGSKTIYSFGDSKSSLGDYAWYSRNTKQRNSDGRTYPVGQKKPNAWGLYDMHGNVSEWCQDWYGDYPRSAVTDPVGPASGRDRVLRGGNWGGGGSDRCKCRTANRSHAPPSYNSAGFSNGFRVVMRLNLVD